MNAFLYPAGALTTAKQIAEREGQDVYVVLASGEDTEVFKIRLGKTTRYIDNYTGYMAHYVKYIEHEKEHKLYLLDVCIGKGHTPSFNYVFDLEEDADEYAEWAEENTVSAKSFKKMFEGFDFF